MTPLFTGGLVPQRERKRAPFVYGIPVIMQASVALRVDDVRGVKCYALPLFSVLGEQYGPYNKKNEIPPKVKIE
ncbi:hypothetical protein TVAG_551010 [Trichomonas vaginalis G3]|uniref:Uncharacterized protein n=1 Tax=Trichomonas vaginalis (strain ATCC PRA-98 / G3) TaxID=412133 RepID=A2H1H3_TRIV3|nr:hypothetical protein TVAG_553290 [Trichomonas vaginalis G3]EAX76745.1 hypothetical protein TVAG_551010 [Trichomonas vaginalis G3]|eukprot:XP_001281250.1 hypothetical protein [Trichomonas vaginalis G3]